MNKQQPELKALHANVETAFSYYIFGWNVTNAPPTPKGEGEFAESPTDAVLLGNGNSQMVPTQIIRFATANPVETQNLSMSRSRAFVSESGYWVLKPGKKRGYVEFSLKLRSPTNVSFTLNCAGCTKRGCAGGQSVIDITVNDKKLVKKLRITNPQWHNETFTLTNDMLVEGKNKIVVLINGKVHLWIAAVGVSTENVPLSASYFWKQIGSGLINPGNTYNRTISVTTGNTTSDTKTESFAKTLGVKIGGGGGGIDKALFGLSMELSAAFTHTTSQSHTITISKQSTSSYSMSITPYNKEKTTFQIWQLCLQYETKGNFLHQALGPDDGPIIITQHPLT